MALIQCAHCGATISDKAPACPKCGEPLAEEPQAAPQNTPPQEDARKAVGVQLGEGLSVKSAPVISLRPATRAQTAPTPTPVATQAGEEAERPQAEEAPQTTDTPSPASEAGTEAEAKAAPQQNGQGGKKLTAVIIIAAVVLCCLAGLIVWAIASSGGKDDGEPATAEEEIAEPAPQTTEEEASAKEAVEEAPDYTIRPHGVGTFRLGRPFKEYDTRDGKDVGYGLRSHFVAEHDEGFGEEWYDAFLEMGSKGETLLRFYGGCHDSRPSLSECEVAAICVCSPRFTTEDGLRVGMSVKEILSSHQVEIELEAGEGG